MGLDHVTVYFYVREQPVIYQDAIVVLAEGLHELGVSVVSNAPYWRKSPHAEDWLVQPSRDLPPDRADIVVVTDTWSRAIDQNFRVHESPLPETVLKSTRGYRAAYVDLADGYETPSWRGEYAAFDVVFRAKFNRRCHHPKNHRPWALGLTQRVVGATSEATPWSQRRRTLLVNFGASHPYPHGTRTRFTPLLCRTLEGIFATDETRDALSVPPSDEQERLWWEQTQRRHSRAYYERLRTSQTVATFCGELIPPAPHRPRYLAGGRRARWNRRAFALASRLDPRPPRWIQWDSWRFWEALAAGCLVFNLDLEHYGVALPVMPSPWEHYIPVRPDNLTEIRSRLQNEAGLAEQIAHQGQAWALRHYSPVALARRFIATMSS